MQTFAQLPWEHRFVDALPGDPETKNVTRTVRDAAYSRVSPTPVRAPRLLAWSEPLAAEIGVTRPDDAAPVSLSLLAGNATLPSMVPYAARYGGHQFGHWAGQLGDGRAITLGEARVAAGGRLEFQLKGAGLTPYSRSADGRAVLRSSLREFLCSEAMYHLGIPTTRALSLVGTGEEVIRDILYDGHPAPEPGAVVCRVAPSFLRFGNFEILAAMEEHDLLKRLMRFLVAEHFPEITPDDPDAAGQLFDRVCARTAGLMVDWTRVGFVHGVMNTDNMSMLGLTIDYGPYGWLEPYDPGWTPNTTDAQSRRYRFGNQPNIAYWNLSCLAGALRPLVKNDERMLQGLSLYRDTFEGDYALALAAKCGLAKLEPTSKAFQDITSRLFALLARVETDYTVFFRTLCDWRAVDNASLTDDLLERSFLGYINAAFYDARPQEDAELSKAWGAWARDYGELLRAEGSNDDERAARMKKVNPKFVPRNFLAQTAIKSAEQGDLAPLERLMRVLRNPYDDQPEEEELARKRPDWARNVPGCSALSCSS